jgi:nucleotide-binding universal stress UspA family protein
MGTSPIPFGTILAAVTPRSSDLHPLGAAFAIARRTGARVAVLAVAAAPWDLLGSEAGASTTMPSRSRLLALAAERLAQRLDAALGADLGERVRVRAAIGIPAIEIVRAADTLGADLIVVGRPRGPETGHAPDPDGADFVSATVRRARVPCLVVPEGFTGWRGIVAALDGTPAARDVLDAARRAGTACGVPVTAVHVAAPALVPAGAAEPAREPVPPVEIVLRAGDPVAEVLAAARDAGANVVAFGQHRGGPADPGCRSVAARLLARTPGAALTVPL